MNKPGQLPDVSDNEMSDTDVPSTPPKLVTNLAKIDMKYLIRALSKYGASDLHLKAGRPPLYRINGNIIPLKLPDLTDQQIYSILSPLISKKLLTDLETDRQINFSFAVPEHGRFRCNAYFQLGCLAAAIRSIPVVTPNIDKLGVPSVIKEFCERPRGIILVTGASGTGKSTTLASMIQYINETQRVHILDIEDPVEFVYQDLKASITQREVGSDTPSFQAALQAGLRQDPDVIVIGELRDLAMIQTALTAAETGHLVLTTLHTNTAVSTINRIFDVFPAESRQQVRLQLAANLIGVVSQQLLLRADGSGRALASEVLVKSPTVEEAIRKDDLNSIKEVMMNSSSHYKMQTMENCLVRLVKNGVVTMEEALKYSESQDNLRLAMSGIDREHGYEMANRYDPTGSKSSL